MQTLKGKVYLFSVCCHFPLVLYDAEHSITNVGCIIKRFAAWD